jgi:stage II sporulation protein GA (sporulation sigma-E factor processing peptidase)
VETYIYADVLLVINYIVNTLLLLSAAKLLGRRLRKRRAVAAALLGAAGSLAIFLPLSGFWLSLGLKLFLSAGVVLLAFPYINFRQFARALFVFFAVSFFFAGVMLAVFILFSPHGMLYYNGVVYFDLSSVTLLAVTTAAYLLLGLWQRLSRKSRVAVTIYRAELHSCGKCLSLPALVDSGNSLTEPFSDVPVMLCGVADIARLLPFGAAEAILAGEHLTGDFTARFGLPLRFIPYRGIGAEGAVPAFRLDRLLLERNGEVLLTESVYVGILRDSPTGEGYRALLNPDLIGMSVPDKKQKIHPIQQGGASK